MADEETTTAAEAAADDSIIRPTPEEVATIPEVKYEYLDHPADVQIHAWGLNLQETFEQAATGMFGYMTEIDTVEMVEVREVEAEAEDLQGLLFHFLDECLFVFSCDPYFITRKVVITEWNIGEGVKGSVGGEKGDVGAEKGDVEEGRSVGEEGSVGGEGGNVGGDDEDVEVMRVCARLYGEEFQLGKHPQGTEVKAITYASMQVYNEPGKCQVYFIVDI